MEALHFELIPIIALAMLRFRKVPFSIKELFMSLRPHTPLGTLLALSASGNSSCAEEEDSKKQDATSNIFLHSDKITFYCFTARGAGTFKQGRPRIIIGFTHILSTNEF